MIVKIIKSAILDSLEGHFLPTPVGVVGHRVEGLVSKLPEDDCSWVSVNKNS